jgi:ribosomal protein L7Ae-like RNA K-turn-binding protein
MSMLGMARRARRLSMGHDMALNSLKSKKASLIIFASDVSDRLIQEFKIASDKFCPDITICKIDETINDVHMLLGYKAGVITVDDKNFSDRIAQLIKQEENANGNKN